MFIKLWALYLAALQAHPLLTKCMTSAVGFILGDGIAQAIAKDRFDGLRTLRFAIIGFTLHAPIAGLYLTSHKIEAADACKFARMRTCAPADTWFTFLEHNVFPKTPTRQSTNLHRALLTQVSV